MVDRAQIVSTDYDFKSPLILLPHPCCVDFWSAKERGIDEVTRGKSRNIGSHKVNVSCKIVVKADFAGHNDISFLKLRKEVIHV